MLVYTSLVSHDFEFYFLQSVRHPLPQGPHRPLLLNATGINSAAGRNLLHSDPADYLQTTNSSFNSLIFFFERAYFSRISACRRSSSPRVSRSSACPPTPATSNGNGPGPQNPVTVVEYILTPQVR